MEHQSLDISRRPRWAGISDAHITAWQTGSSERRGVCVGQWGQGCLIAYCLISRKRIFVLFLLSLSPSQFIFCFPVVRHNLQVEVIRHGVVEQERWLMETHGGVICVMLKCRCGTKGCNLFFPGLFGVGMQGYDSSDLYIVLRIPLTQYYGRVRTPSFEHHVTIGTWPTITFVIIATEYRLLTA